MRNLTLLIVLLLTTPSFSQKFITRDGKKLKKDGQEILLRGISFGNQVWVHDDLPDEHHTETDFKRVAELGMNVIRFYMNYLTFESDAAPYQYKEQGWQWLDRNIQWAKNNNIYLILNMHVPQGGFQSQCKGEQLWLDPENQNRLVALWKAIADRYKDEPQIAAFDLVNEPTPSDSVGRWYQLSSRIVNAIREVNQTHLLVVERAIALGCDYGYKDARNNYPLLDEQNLMFTVHMYEPHEYSHQNQPWANTGEGGNYPDENRITPPTDLAWGIGQYNNPALPAGNTSWTYFAGRPFKVDSAKYLIVRPGFYGHRLGSGKAYYDNIVINEVDASGKVIREVARYTDFKDSDTYFWSEKNDGSKAIAAGYDDNKALTVTGTSGYCTVNAHKLQFKAEYGKYYSISGYMKGDNIPAGSTAGFTLELFYSPSGLPVFVRNKHYLAQVIAENARYPEENNYPVYYGEFGLVRECFGEKGGEQWVKDVLDIYDSLGYHFTYHVYREDLFGLYKGTTTPVDPSTVNQGLYDTFRNFFSREMSVTDKKKDRAEISIFPNPAHESFKFILHSPGNYKLTISDQTGRIMWQGTYSGQQQFETGKYLEPGVYYCTIEHDGEIFTQKLIRY